jgi:hypothetical protein
VVPSAQVVPQEPPEPPVPPLLLADCSVKAAGAVVEARVAVAVPAVLEVVALAVVAAVLRAVHTQQVLAGLVVLAGHWYWSSEHETVCRC